MLNTLILKLKSKNNNRYGSYISSMLQGVLMEKLTPEYAEAMHQNRYHPYSQHVICNGENIYWVIHTLTGEAEKNILQPLLQEGCQAISLKYKNDTLDILEKNSSSISHKELMEKNYFQECSPYLHLVFITPTAFKQNGEYCIFPSIRLLFQSLMLKYDASSIESSVYSDELLEHYEKFAKITRYKLKSTIFQMNGAKIPSFIGEIYIHVKGPQPMINLAHLLAEFGTYSGVGIKTGIGMGAFEVK